MRDPRLAIGALLCALVLMAPMRTAFAHTFEPAVLDLHEREAGSFDVVWKLPAAWAGLLAPGGTLPVPQLPAACVSVVGAAAAGDGEEGPAFWRVNCGAGELRGERLAVRGLDGSRLDVIVRITWRDGSTASGVLRSGEEELLVPAGRSARGLPSGTPARTVLWSYGRLGVEHILFGYDHLLFVLALLLLVRSWSMLLKTISAFTVAHSLALALAVLHVVEVPPAPVEASIALSILLVAVELTRPADAPLTLTRRYPWAVAFAFGLLHGLGFAGALAAIGLPPDQIPLALLAFNCGVEVGQLMFVTAMVAPLVVLRHISATWPRLRLVPAYAIGTLASAWTLERVLAFWA
jgi:hydrogenase/urease accessory protein HupE